MILVKIAPADTAEREIPLVRDRAPRAEPARLRVRLCDLDLRRVRSPRRRPRGACDHRRQRKRADRLRFIFSARHRIRVTQAVRLHRHGSLFRRNDVLVRHKSDARDLPDIEIGLDAPKEFRSDHDIISARQVIRDIHAPVLRTAVRVHPDHLIVAHAHDDPVRSRHLEYRRSFAHVKFLSLRKYHDRAAEKIRLAGIIKIESVGPGLRYALHDTLVPDLTHARAIHSRQH